MTSRRQAGNNILVMVLVPALLLLVHFAKPPATGLWVQTFVNSMHVPVFGVIALCIYVAIGMNETFSPGRRIGVAVAVSFLLGALSEAAQIPGPRHASIEDLRSDWLGAAGTVLLAVAFTTVHALGRRARSASALAGVTLLIIALLPLIAVSAAYLERHRQLPLVFSFDSRFNEKFFVTQHATLSVSQRSAAKQGIGYITLQDGAWPGIIFHDVWPDWRAYSALVIELGLDSDTPLDINIRVHDRLHKSGKQPYNDRFNMQLSLQPGLHTIRVPLSQILNAPDTRQMNLSKIDGIVIFCSAGNAGRSFSLTEIRLE